MIIQILFTNISAYNFNRFWKKIYETNINNWRYVKIYVKDMKIIYVK